MKYIAAICASFLVAFTVVCAFPTRGESAIYDDVLRFHVIAESDTEEAQSLKLMVRDAALEYISERMTDCTTVSEACERVEENLDGIENIAEECARKNGYAGKVKAYLTKEEYPRRVYGDAVMPAGEYTSLRIVIGEGEGHNWWCVMFPDLCVTKDDKVRINNTARKKMEKLLGKKTIRKITKDKYLGWLFKV